VTILTGLQAERQALKAHLLAANPPLIEKPEANPEEPELPQAIVEAIEER
jgi:hypothetical protein